MPELRTLTVGCPSGLANRLRVLLSGLAWERLSGRRFTVLWPRSAPCSAAFHELFVPLPCVMPASEEEVMELPVLGSYLFPPMFNIAGSTTGHLRFRTSSWLTPPNLAPAAALVARLLPRAPAPFRAIHAQVLRDAAELFGSLEPQPEISARVGAFRARYFRDRMIGVHIRRGDFGEQRPDALADLKRIEGAVKRYLDEMPGAGILVATDDGAINPHTARSTNAASVLERLTRAFGGRVVSTKPRSLDRRDPVAVQDALVDLLLLRETHAFAGTVDSSFSEMAVLGRDVPRVFCRAVNPMRWIWRLTMIEPLVVAAGVIRFGRLAPFPVLVAHHKAELRNLLRRKSHG